MTSLDTLSKPENDIAHLKLEINSLYEELKVIEENGRACFTEAYEALKRMGEHNRNAHDTMHALAEKIKKVEQLIKTTYEK